MTDEPITKSPAISRKEAEELIAKMARDLASAMGHGGANVQVGVQDQRFTKLKDWFNMSLGTVALGVTTFAAVQFFQMKESIIDLNGKISVVIAQREVDNKRQDDRYYDLADRVRRVEDRK